MTQIPWLQMAISYIDDTTNIIKPFFYIWKLLISVLPTEYLLCYDRRYQHITVYLLIE